MTPPTTELSLELVPRSRVDIIDVSRQIQRQHGEILAPYPKALYCSYHTTAGYIDEPFLNRLNHSPASVEAYLEAFRALFPPGAPYRHDQMDLRTELTEEQRCVEPHNADSHLTFISAGLENCVTYDNRVKHPVFFVDLDGINGPIARTRRSTVIGYSREEVVAREEVHVPVSTHAIDSVSLSDVRLGLYQQLQELVQRYGIERGRLDVTLSPNERHAGLTVNEFETLLMKHDLPEVLQNPLRFMAQKGRNMLRDPRNIPTKAKSYAKYDFVQVLNQAFDSLGLHESLIERLIDRFLAMPAERFLRMKRSVCLLVAGNNGSTPGSIVHGRYQSPILIQWRKADRQVRKLHVTLTRFE